MTYKYNPPNAKKRVVSCLVLIVVGVALVLALRFISDLSNTPASPTATLTSIPEVSRPTATLLPVAAGQQAGWKPVKSVCLKVEVSYPETWKTIPTDSIARDLRATLAAAGIQVLETGGACDANLSLSLKGEAIASSYTGLSPCYQSARFFGKVTLSATGRTALEKAVSGASSAPSSIKESECIKTPEFADGADSARSMVAVDTVSWAWGDEMLVNGFDSAVNPNYSSQVRKRLFAMEQKALPILVQGLKHSRPSIRQKSAEVIAELQFAHSTLTRNEVEAIKAESLRSVLPTLVVTLDDEYPDVVSAALTALNYMTDQSFKTPAEWKKWWGEKK